MEPSPPKPNPTLRRTRFVCISDTHNCNVKLPRGDVLIHAGDLTNQGTYSELSKAAQWLEKAKFEAKIVVAGNHDVTLDKDFYSEHGLYFHNKAPQDASACLSLLADSPIITYLDHASATICLSSPDGPHTTFTVFGSPFSPRSYGPSATAAWAFGYDAPSPQRSGPTATLPTLWDAIPLSADVVVTHTPARGHRDETRDRRSAGCEALRRALWRVRPRLAVCGHVHESRGSERVRWMLDATNVAYEEEAVREWADPGTGSGEKLSLVDLTGKKGGPALDNDGGNPVVEEKDIEEEHIEEEHVEEEHVEKEQHVEKDAEDAERHRQAPTNSLENPEPGVFPTSTPRSGTQGLGGNPGSVRSDQAALAGRLGRRETCVVNCAVMASSYPRAGARKLNKAIVVDLDLPVWDEYDISLG